MRLEPIRQLWNRLAAYRHPEGKAHFAVQTGIGYRSSVGGNGDRIVRVETHFPREPGKHGRSRTTAFITRALRGRPTPSGSYSWEMSRIIVSATMCRAWMAVRLAQSHRTMSVEYSDTQTSPPQFFPLQDRIKLDTRYYTQRCLYTVPDLGCYRPSASGRA
jgi:hypothetical protein